MEISMKQSRQLDKILSELLGETKVHSVQDINKLFPQENLDYCTNLFYILNNYYPKLLYPKSGPTEELFWATGYVKAFLSEGGFSSLFDKENAKQEKIRASEELNQEKLKYETRNAKRIYKTYWWTFFFALIALLVSLYNFLKDFFN